MEIQFEENERNKNSCKRVVKMKKPLCDREDCPNHVTIMEKDGLLKFIFLDKENMYGTHESQMKHLKCKALHPFGERKYVSLLAILPLLTPQNSRRDSNNLLHLNWGNFSKFSWQNVSRQFRKLSLFTFTTPVMKATFETLF